VVTATVSGTTSETTVYTYTVPGGTLSTNKMIRLTAMGKMQGSVSQTVTVRIKYGTTTIGSYDISATSTTYGFLINASISARNATNSQQSVTEINMNITFGSAMREGMIVGAVKDISEDSATDRDLAITFQPSSTTVTAYMNIVQVELI